MASKPTVQIITTGGTIASRVDPSSGAALPALHADDLVRLVPALEDVAVIRTQEFSLIPSWNMTPAMMYELAQRIQEFASRPDISGIVITHGTDTMEETAFALDLLLDVPFPIVLTGAQRNPSLTGPDGPRNLLAAVRVAADPGTRDLGVLLVMNDEIHAARYVTKTHTTALQAFASPDLAPIGLVDDEGVWIRWRSARLPRLPLAPPEPAVYLIKMAAGMDELLLRSVLDANARGLVIEGSGAGHVPSDWEPAVEDMVKAGIPVVLVSRCVGGRVAAIYGGPGSGRSLRALGVLPAGDLTGPKARLALMFALGAGLSPDEISAYFGQVAD